MCMKNCFCNPFCNFYNSFFALKFVISVNRVLNTFINFLQGTHTDLVVQIVLIAESMRLQAMMGTYGIQTQTPHEVEPVQILSSSQLVKVYEKLGINSKLNLQGRPARPIGSLGTSKVSIDKYDLIVIIYKL